MAATATVNFSDEIARLVRNWGEQQRLEGAACVMRAVLDWQEAGSDPQTLDRALADAVDEARNR